MIRLIRQRVDELVRKRQQRRRKRGYDRVIIVPEPPRRLRPAEQGLLQGLSLRGMKASNAVSQRCIELLKRRKARRRVDEALRRQPVIIIETGVALITKTTPNRGLQRDVLLQVRPRRHDVQGPLRLLETACCETGFDQLVPDGEIPALGRGQRGFQI